MKSRCGDCEVEWNEVKWNLKFVVWNWNQAVRWREIDSEGCMIWDDWKRSAW